MFSVASKGLSGGKNLQVESEGRYCQPQNHDNTRQIHHEKEDLVPGRRKETKEPEEG
jgi:hypothetical protein